MMRKFIAPIALVAGALVLAGCATRPCTNDLSYRNAKAHAAPTIPRGLDAPAADPAYKIPSGKIAKSDPSTPKECIIFPPEVIDPDNPPKKSG